MLMMLLVRATISAMETLGDLANEIAKRIPLHVASPWDQVGMQIGDRAAVLTQVGVCHEVNEAVVSEAIANDVNALIAYHPLLFRPTTTLVAGSTPNGRAFRLVEAGIGLCVVHTAFDVASGGSADALANALGLVDVAGFGLADADGEHPLGEAPMIGRLGMVERQSIGAFTDHVKVVLGAPNVRVAGGRHREIATVAVVPGSGAGFSAEAAESGADVFVTGDISHHQAVAATDAGMAVIDAGHAPTEQPGMAALVALMNEIVGSVVDLTHIPTDPWSK